MRFRSAVWALAAVLFLCGLYLRFGYEPALPPLPARPTGSSTLSAFRALDYTSNVYLARLEQDAAAAGVPMSSLSGVFPHDSAEPGRRLVAGGPRLEVGDLALSVRVGRVTARLERGELTMDHLILRIENRTDRHLAYRVETRVPLDPRGCIEKAALPHNAIALSPREVVERTECGRGGIDSLIVSRVETVELPALAHHYVSRLVPGHIGLDARTTHGHQAAEGSACGDIPEQAILRGIEKNAVSWRDVIDFYGRHSCSRYIFPVGYRAFIRDGEWTLPIDPTAVRRSL